MCAGRETVVRKMIDVSTEKVGAVVNQKGYSPIE